MRAKIDVLYSRIDDYSADDERDVTARHIDTPTAVRLLTNTANKTRLFPATRFVAFNQWTPFKVCNRNLQRAAEWSDVFATLASQDVCLAISFGGRLFRTGSGFLYSVFVYAAANAPPSIIRAHFVAHLRHVRHAAPSGGGGGGTAAIYFHFPRTYDGEAVKRFARRFGFDTNHEQCELAGMYEERVGARTAAGQVTPVRAKSAL